MSEKTCAACDCRLDAAAIQVKIGTRVVGSINYVEHGRGPVALFVHGVLLNGYLWRHQLAELGDLKRCIAVDLLAHGNTDVAAGQDVSVTANAHMLAQFLNALKIDQVDLVGNDSGGGICQIFAALFETYLRPHTRSPQRIHDLERFVGAFDFFPEERSVEFNTELRSFWMEA